MCVKDMLFAGFAPRHQLAVCVVVLSDVCVERSPRLWHSDEARHRPPAVHPLVCVVFVFWVAVVSALFPCLVGCRLRVVSLPCCVGLVLTVYVDRESLRIRLLC